MHYYVRQQLLTAIRLSIDELERNVPDFDGIADLLDECSDILGAEIERLKTKLS